MLASRFEKCAGLVLAYMNGCALNLLTRVGSLVVWLVLKMTWRVAVKAKSAMPSRTLRLCGVFTDCVGSRRCGSN